MLHNSLDSPTSSSRTAIDRPVPSRNRRSVQSGVILASIIETLDLPAGDNLLQASVLRVTDLDEVVVKEHEVRSRQSSRLRSSDELHDDATADLAMLVDIDGAIGVAEEELGLAEAQHAQRALVFDVADNVLHALTLYFRYALGHFAFKRQDLKASRGTNGEGAGEEVDSCTFRGDVELVEFAEEFGGAAFEVACALAFRGLLVNWLEDFEGRGEVVAFLVED